jgi:hypothetical protein
MHHSYREPQDGNIVADIGYFPALGIPIPTSAWRTRYLGDHDAYTRPMYIHDVRTSEKRFDLDTHGFQFIKLCQKKRVTRDDEEETVKREYYPELENLATHLFAPRPTGRCATIS